MSIPKYYYYYLFKIVKITTDASKLLSGSVKKATQKVNVYKDLSLC